MDPIDMCLKDGKVGEMWENMRMMEIWIYF